MIKIWISLCSENGYFLSGHKMTSIVEYVVFYDSMFLSNLTIYFGFSYELYNCFYIHAAWICQNIPTIMHKHHQHKLYLQNSPDWH